jgi:hypothetical protein
MKNLLLSIVLGSCFLAPAFAKDSVESEHEGNSKPLVTTTFAGNTATDTVSFRVQTSNLGKDVQVKATWEDMAINDTSYGGTLSWTLGGASTGSGFLAENTQGKSFITLSGLGVGSYTLTFKGAWNAVSITGKHDAEYEFKKGSVELDDVHFSKHISAVPEPETYAMMLAGLGMLVTFVRRSGSKQA